MGKTSFFGRLTTVEYAWMFCTIGVAIQCGFFVRSIEATDKNRKIAMEKMRGVSDCE
ncbi:unnamed protein product [Rhodiola kirilowii]